MNYVLCVCVSYGIWCSLWIESLHKSTVHSLVSLFFSFIGISNFVIAVFSSGYYIDDLKYTKKGIYVCHHLFSIYMLSLCYPENFLSRVMIIEGSVPFLNYYISVDEKFMFRKIVSLFVYFCSHVYFRNFLLYNMYNELDLKTIESFNMQLIQVFIFLNFWWSFTTFRKLYNLLKKTLKNSNNND